MKRILAVAAACAIGIGGVVATATPAYAVSWVTCSVNGLDGSVVPTSTFTDDGRDIWQCTGVPKGGPSKVLVNTCPAGTTAVNSEPTPYEGSTEGASGIPPFYWMTASCR